MADYVSAFNKGMDAARAAERNRSDIEAVFAELNEQIRAISNGRISIERVVLRKDQGASGDLAGGFPGDSTSLVTPIRAGKHEALVVRSLCENYRTELAKWEPGRTGFPCVIVFGKTRLICSDRAGLEDAISTLLEDPLVGQHLFNQIQRANMPGSTQDTRQ